MTTRLIAITPGDAHRVDRRPWILALARAGLRHLVIREPALDAHALDGLVLAAWASIPDVAVHDRHPRARHYGGPIHLPAAGEPGRHPAPWSRSCHTAEEVDRALAQGASWVTLSPVWPPRSKPADRRPVLGPDRFLALAAGRPVAALGGIDADRAALLARGGAWGVAVCGALFDAATPDEAASRCAALRAALDASYRPVSETGSPTGYSRSS